MRREFGGASRLEGLVGFWAVDSGIAGLVLRDVLLEELRMVSVFGVSISLFNFGVGERREGLESMEVLVGRVLRDYSEPDNRFCMEIIRLGVLIS